MWVFTRFGFFSVVRKPGEALLTVRARSAADLDRLREVYLPTLSTTVEGAGTDYPFRARASGEEVAAAVAKAVADIDYSNFKNEVRRTLGRSREGVMHAVWSAAREIEKERE